MCYISKSFKDLLDLEIWIPFSYNFVSKIYYINTLSWMDHYILILLKNLKMVHILISFQNQLNLALQYVIYYATFRTIRFYQIQLKFEDLKDKAYKCNVTVSFHFSSLAEIWYCSISCVLIKSSFRSNKK